MNCEEILKRFISTIGANDSLLPYIKNDFCKKYNFLKDREGLCKLLAKFQALNMDVNILDNCTEFCLAYDILIKCPEAKIIYEEPICINGKIYTPDFRVELNGEIFYIQVKRIRKSVSYHNAAKSLDNTKERKPGLFMVDDIEQVVNALEKAAKFQPIEKCTYIIVQQNSFNTIGRISIADALYGREGIVQRGENSKPSLERNRGWDKESLIEYGGFLLCENIKSIAAYVLARADNDIFFGDRKYEIFKKSKDEYPEYKLGMLFNYERVYNPTTFIEDDYD